MIRRLIVITGLLSLFIILHSSFTYAAGLVQLPRTGQTYSYLAADDGALRMGDAWPTPRFNDNGNGTVTDNLTGLVWLKNANCTETVGGIANGSGYLTWSNAITWSNNLASGNCGLSDGSTAGQWRLPNINELESLVDVQKHSPALPSGHPFTAVQFSSLIAVYWTSTTDSYSSDDAWVISMYNGSVGSRSKADNYYNVWPVHGGQSGSSGSMVNGICGSSDGGIFAVAPATNLCSAGTPTSVTGTGPWSWSCTGLNAGTTASCSANIQIPTGDLNNDGKVDVADALKALRIAVGLQTVTADNYTYADVAPLKDGRPAPDGIIDIADALVLLEKAVGLVSW